MRFSSEFYRFMITFPFFVIFVLLIQWKNEDTKVVKEKMKIIDCQCLKTKTKVVGNLKNIFPDTDPYGGGNISQTVDRRHPNINSDVFQTETNRCNLIPYFSKLNWDGVWQTTDPFITEDRRIVTWNLYSASCDRKGGFHCDVVRILALSTKYKPPKPLCYFWKSIDSDPIVTEARNIVYFGFGSFKLKLYTYMIECETPEPTVISAVSISYEPCSAVTNYVQINPGETRKAELAIQASQSNTKLQSTEVGEYDVAACLIALYYYSEDISPKLIEWLELLKAMKVSKVLTYIYDIHPNNLRVLAHYERMGFVSITYFNNPAPYLNTPIMTRIWSQNDMESYLQVARIHRSDCILRNRHQYNYIYHLDRDEIPLLKRHKYLPDLIKDVTFKVSNDLSSLSLKWQPFNISDNPAEFSKTLPSYSFMFKYNSYVKNCAVHCQNHKGIYDTRKVILIKAHDAFSCYGECKDILIANRTATTGHFRAVWGEPAQKFEDNTLEKYRDEVIGKVNVTLHTLRLID